VLVGKERARGSLATEDMIRVLANEAVGEGVLDNNEAEYVDRVFNYGHRTVGDLKTPRSHIFFLSAQMPVREMINRLRKTRHTKVPIYDGQRDNVLGFLYARDLVGIDIATLEQRPNKIMEFLREPFLVPESKPAPDLFHTFRRRRLSVALTVDEYGGITGLITMEDLLECIFGDIPSPSDETDEPVYLKLPDGSLRIDGSMPVRHFNRLVRGKLEAGDAETVAGLLLRKYGEFPAEGTQIVVLDLLFEISETRRNRIEQVTVTKIEPGEADAVKSAGDDSRPVRAPRAETGDRRED
jgi:CBS domain containing-hemolysin-like protein